MSSRITCPECKRQLKLAQPLTKPRRVQCPRCNCRFKVEVADVVTAAAAPEKTLAASAKEPAPRPTVDITQSFDFFGEVEPPPEPVPPAAAPPAPVATEAAQPAAATPPEPAASPPMVPAEVPTVGPKLIRKPLVVAGLVVALLVSLGSAGAFYATQNNAAEIVAEEPKPTQRQEEPVKPVEPSVQQAEREKRQAEVDRLLVQGNTALTERNLVEALAAYTAAQKLLPQNVDAAKGIAAVKEAQEALAKAKDDGEKTKAEFARCLNDGKTALAEKQFAQAVRAFETAKQLIPGDADVAKWLEDARKALAEDTEEKAKLAEYEKHLNIGRAALAAQRYAEAIREFTAALQVLPGDPDALQLRRQAENRVAQLQNNETKKEDFIKAMQLGQAAGKAGNFQEAVQAFETALQIFPNDKDAKNALNVAKQALAQAMTQANGLLGQANTALQFGRIEEANRLFSEVLRLSPNNEAAQKGLRATEQFMGNAATAQQAYFRYMNQGAAAFQARRYDEAARNYAEALRLFPNDRQAAAGLRDARQYLEGEVKNRGQYQKAMEAATGFLKVGNYREAVRSYQEALTLMPDDIAALTGLRQARYSMYMAEGENDMKARRFVEAVRAFEGALRESPGDQAASRNLAQARALAGKK